MAGQGKVTLSVANQLESAGWHVAYVCVPNTPHVGAVAIPTKHGSSRQRYPDIVAGRSTVLAVVEVEMNLSRGVALDIIERFREMRTSLLDTPTYEMWRDAVRRECAVVLPAVPDICFCLITTRPWRTSLQDEARRLRDEGILVFPASDFRPEALVVLP